MSHKETSFNSKRLRRLSNGIYELTLSNEEFIAALRLEQRIQVIKEGSREDQLAFLLLKDTPTYNDIMKELEEDGVCMRDVAFFSNKDDFETFKDYRKTFEKYKKQGNLLEAPINILKLHDSHLKKIKKLKRAFLIKAAAVLRKEELEDEVEKFSKKLKKNPTTYEEASNIIEEKHFPNYSKFVDKIDLIIWDIPIGEFEKNVDGAILKNLQKIVPKDIQGYVSFELGWWPFPFLNVQYEKQGNVDCLNWFADIYTVASEKVRLSEGEHKLTIADQELPIILEGYSLGYYEIFLEPWQTDMKGIFLFSTPFNLFFGLVKGENEPDGCEIIKRSDKKIRYRIDGFGDLVLSDNFIEFVKSLGESINKLKKLLEFGFIDQTTYEIIIEKMKPKPVKPIVKIRRKDKERLMRIAEVKEHMSNSWWGKLLGITKEGAWYFLNRFEKEKFLTLDKSKQGVKAELTELGKEALGLL